MLPDTLAQLLRGAFPGAALEDPEPTFGGFSNLTVALTIDGRRCVVKAATLPAKRADVRHEARVLPAARAAGLPVPELVRFAEDAEWSAAVTAHIAGTPGLRLYERPAAELPPHFAALGAVLAQVHACPPPEAGGVWAAGLAGEIPHRAAGLPVLAAELERLPLDDGLRRTLIASLAHPAWHAAAPRLTHGDAGLHNTLWHGGLAALLDWEWAAWGPPLLDLAWAGWTIRFRALGAAAWEALLAGYAQGGGVVVPEAAALRALELGQMAAILVRSYGRPGAWEEWLRRATAAVQSPS